MGNRRSNYTNYCISLVSSGTINNFSISSYLISRDEFQIFTFFYILKFLEFKNDKILTINCGSLNPVVHVSPRGTIKIILNYFIYSQAYLPNNQRNDIIKNHLFRLRLSAGIYAARPAIQPRVLPR